MQKLSLDTIMQLPKVTQVPQGASGIWTQIVPPSKLKFLQAKMAKTKKGTKDRTWVSQQNEEETEQKEASHTNSKG